MYALVPRKPLILEAEEWAFARKRDILNEGFLNTLHKRMFGHVWKWAGKFRHTEKRIGVDPVRIAIALRELCEDCEYWTEHNTYSDDEIAARFHHRLVYIRPCANGIGRHARLAADLLLHRMDQPRLTWGREKLVNAGETRKAYLAALRAADRHDYGPLLSFVRS